MEHLGIILSAQPPDFDPPLLVLIADLTYNTADCHVRAKTKGYLGKKNEGRIALDTAISIPS